MRAARMRSLAAIGVLLLSPLGFAGAVQASAGQDSQAWTVTIEPSGADSFGPVSFDAPDGLCGSSTFDSGERKAKVCFGPIDGVQTATGWVLDAADDSELEHFAVGYEGSTVSFTRGDYRVSIAKK
nr:Hypothetical_protein [Stutzerimonas stutzeri]